MFVKMLLDTAILNGYAHVGDVVDVDEATAGRWLDNKIAQFAISEPEEVKNEVTEELTTSPVPEVKKPAVPKGKKKCK